MENAFYKAVTMAMIALPTMFVVIGVFIIATKLLHKTFPAVSVDKDED